MLYSRQKKISLIFIAIIMALVYTHSKGMAMSSFTPQSTDKQSDNTNKYQANVIKRGSFTITPTAVGAGFAGTAAVSLTANLALGLYPNLDLYLKDPISIVDMFFKAPYSEINTSTGVVQRNVWYNIEYSPGGASSDPYIALVTYYFNRSSDTPVTFYYTVYSTEIAPQPNQSFDY